MLKKHKFITSIFSMIAAPCALFLNVSCGCQLTNSTNEGSPTNSFFVNSTVGKAFTWTSNEPTSVDEDLIIKFVSTKYEAYEGLSPLPVHKDLKTTDLEVLDAFNNNLIDQCELNNNILVVPGSVRKEAFTITINILGAEIADWITWSTISKISSDDVDDEEHELAKDYFQVGDYKEVWDYSSQKADKLLGHATIIGFYVQNFRHEKEGTESDEPAPFTFEMRDYHYYDKNINWWDGFQWERDHGADVGYKDLFDESIKFLSSKKLDFTPLEINFYTDKGEIEKDKNKTYFFPLSCEELFGASPEARSDYNSETHRVYYCQSIPLESIATNNSPYPYYRIDQYHWTKSGIDRVFAGREDLSEASVNRFWTRSTYDWTDKAGMDREFRYVCCVNVKDRTVDYFNNHACDVENPDGHDYQKSYTAWTIFAFCL